MSRRTPVRSLGRSSRRPREPAPVSTRYCCPRCGGDHPRPECGLDVGESRPLDVGELRAIRQDALEELAAAVLGGAQRAHLEHVAGLAAAVDARLERLAD